MYNRRTWPHGTRTSRTASPAPRSPMCIIVISIAVYVLITYKV